MDIEDIFDKNFGQHKAEHMQAIAKKYSTKLNEIYFVDDQLSYLKGTDVLGERKRLPLLRRKRIFILC